MSSGTAREYDSDQVSLILGPIPLSDLGGFADGSFVTVKRKTASFGEVVGTDGEVTRSKLNDRRGEIRFKVMQSSAANDLLSELLISDENSPNGAGVTSFVLKDNGGSTLYAAAKCWISEWPESDFDRQAGTREWVLTCARLDPFIGANRSL